MSAFRLSSKTVSIYSGKTRSKIRCSEYPVETGTSADDFVKTRSRSSLFCSLRAYKSM